MAKSYQQRPSALMGIEDPWVAYMLDRAVFVVGNQVEAKYEERDKEGKRRHTLEECLGIEMQPKPMKLGAYMQFASGFELVKGDGK